MSRTTRKCKIKTKTGNGNQRRIKDRKPNNKDDLYGKGRPATKGTTLNASSASKKRKRKWGGGDAAVGGGGWFCVNDGYGGGCRWGNGW